MAQDLGAEFEAGLADALAFVAGGLGGWQLGKACGFDAIAASAWDSQALLGLLFILAGLGLGKLAAQRYKRMRADQRYKRMRAGQRQPR